MHQRVGFYFPLFCPDSEGPPHPSPNPQSSHLADPESFSPNLPKVGSSPPVSPSLVSRAYNNLLTQNGKKREIALFLMFVDT